MGRETIHFGDVGECWSWPRWPLDRRRRACALGNGINHAATKQNSSPFSKRELFFLNDRFFTSAKRAQGEAFGLEGLVGGVVNLQRKAQPFHEARAGAETTASAVPCYCASARVTRFESLEMPCVSLTFHWRSLSSTWRTMVAVPGGWSVAELTRR